MNVLITTKEQIKLEKMINVNIEYFDELNISSINDIEDKYEMIVGGFELKKIDFSKFSRLKLIQLISSGFDFISLEDNSKIILANARGVYSDAIAEWVLSSLLMELKNFRTIMKNQMNHIWNRDIKSNSIKDKNILVFGTGSIGNKITKNLSLMGVNVDGVNSNGRNIEGFNKTMSLWESLAKIQNYDVLIFCLPSTNETINFINENNINNLKSGSILINVGRGDLIKEEVFKIRDDITYILDVHYHEPLAKDSEVWDLANVFVSPHISFRSNEYVNSLKDLIQINILNFLNQNEIVNRVN